MIPSGLHVQIDLQTGEKKAKLMEENKKNNRNSLAMTESSKPENIVCNLCIVLKVNHILLVTN